MPEFTANGTPAADDSLFVRGFIEALLFCETSSAFDSESWFTDERRQESEGELPSDCGFDDLHPESHEEIRAFCADFQSAAQELLALAYDRDGYDETQAGRDLYFTRVGHGIGYWDRKELEDDLLGDRLSETAGRGEIHPFYGDHVEHGDAPFWYVESLGTPFRPTEAEKEMRADRLAKAREASADWSYFGDVNLEHGGIFYRMDSRDDDYVNVCEVTDLDSAIGQDGCAMVETGSMLFPTTPGDLANVLDVIGFHDNRLQGPPDLRTLVSACMAYGGFFDRDVFNGLHVVAIGPWDLPAGGGMDVDAELPAGADLETYVRERLA